MNQDLFPIALATIVGMFLGLWITSISDRYHRRNRANIMVPPKININNNVLRAGFEEYLTSLKWKLEKALKDVESGMVDDVPPELAERKTTSEREEWIRFY